MHQTRLHDSGPQQLAEPSTYDSFIHNISPVLTGAWRPPMRTAPRTLFGKLCLWLAALVALAAGAVQAQTLADLRNDAATPADVLTYGMGWAQQRHTPLKQITPANVK